MANIHKAHKSSKKYGFQRNSRKTRSWLIAIAAAIVAVIIGVVVYNSSLSGEIKVAAPAEASLANIAENWSVLATHTDKFTNYPTTKADGTESNTLFYMGGEAADLVYIYINPETDGPIENSGVYGRPSIFTSDLGQLFSGELSLSDTTVVLQAGNENCVIRVEDYQAEKLDDSLLTEVIAELEAIIAAGPVVTEEPAEESAEESAETAE